MYSIAFFMYFHNVFIFYKSTSQPINELTYLEKGRNVGERLLHALFHCCSRTMLRGYADEAYDETKVGIGHFIYKNLLLQTVSFAYLALDAVAVDGMVEAFLWNTDKNGNGGGAFLHFEVYYSKRKRNK